MCVCKEKYYVETITDTDYEEEIEDGSHSGLTMKD